MPEYTVAQLATVPQSVLDRLAAEYKRPRVPSTWQGIHPKVIAVALKIAHNDVHRIVVDDGQSLVIHNNRMW